MSKKLNLIGKQFGKLKVVNYLGTIERALELNRKEVLNG